MPKPRAFFGLISLCLICSSVLVAADTSTQTKTWTFEKQQFAIDTPAGWENIPSDNSIVVLRLKPDITPVPGQFSDVFVITVTPLSDAADQATLNQYASGAMKGNGKGKADVKVSDAQDCTIAGEPAKKYTVEKKLNGLDTTATYVIAHRAHNLYVFLYMTSPARVDEGQKNLDTVLKSVKWQ